VPTVGITEDVYDSVSWIVSVKRRLPEEPPPEAKVYAGITQTDDDGHGELFRHTAVMSGGRADVHSRSATVRDDEEDDKDDEEEDEEEDEDGDEDSDDANRCEHGNRHRCEECDFRGIPFEFLEKDPEISPQKGPEEDPQKAPGSAPEEEKEVALTDKQREFLKTPFSFSINVRQFFSSTCVTR
jgi:hypothetical protein